MPGLLAKPVIDITVAVASGDAAAACIPLMETLGYAHCGAHGDDPQHRYFVQNAAGRGTLTDFDLASRHLAGLLGAKRETRYPFRDT